jgi:integrase
MRDLLYELKHLVERHREGSYATQANRHALLQQMGRHLLTAGYKHLHVYDLKGRHVNALVRQWQADGLSPATQKNRMSVLRFWATAVGKPAMIKADNGAYGIAKRVPTPNVSKARQLSPEGLSRVTNAYVRMSLELQRAFGLRREESMKVRPWQADEGFQLRLQGSWTKGGRERTIPILTPEQREVLDRAKALVRFQGASLIPKAKTYAQQLHAYEGQCRRANLDKLHGLRHSYAQARFLAVAGFACPAAGGPLYAQLTADQREVDADARAIISTELGHSRLQITIKYLGR